MFTAGLLQQQPYRKTAYRSCEASTGISFRCLLTFSRNMAAACHLEHGQVE